MIFKRTLLLLFAFVGIWVCMQLVACSQLGAENIQAGTTPPITETTHVSQSTLVPRATRTPLTPIDPIYTVTPFPEKISSPSVIASATSTPLASLSPLVLPNNLANINIITHYNFEYLNENKSGQALYRTEHGYIEIEDISFWRSFQKRYPVSFEQGNGIILQYKLEGASEARAFFTTTTPDGVNLRWGVILNNQPYTEVLEADQEIGGIFLPGNLKLEPDHWYFLLLRMDQQASFSVIIWDLNAPEQQLAFTQSMPAEWGTQTWDFVLRGKSGKLRLKEYVVIGNSTP